MTHQESSPAVSFIFISGIFNFEAGEHISTVGPMLKPLKYSLEHSLGMHVEKDIVLDGLGFLLNKRTVYKGVRDKILTRADNRPNTKIVVAGHSMGGLILRQFMEEMAEAHDNRFAGAITINTPHLEADAKAWPRIMQEPVRSANQYISNLAEPRPREEGGTNWMMYGTNRDRIASPDSALPDFPGVYRVILKRKGEAVPGGLQGDKNLEVADVNTLGLPWILRHSSVFAVPSAVQIITGGIGRMLSEADLRPAPETHGHVRPLAATA